MRDSCSRKPSRTFTYPRGPIVRATLDDWRKTVMTRETYRGVKLTARSLRGRDYGRVRCTVNGVPFGDWIGTESAHIESMRRTVDAARERPDAYADYWQSQT